MREVAECYDGRLYPTAALKAWFREFGDFPYAQVQAYIRNWIRTSPKKPMIADILKPLNDRRSDAVEAQELAGKEAEYRLVPATEYGRICYAKIKAILASKSVQSRRWAYELRDRKRAGGRLNYSQELMAKKACGLDWETDNPFPNLIPMIERIPGEDDE